MKSNILWKIIKIDKLSIFTKKKENTQIISVRNENEDVSIVLISIKRLKNIKNNFCQ